MMLQRKHSNVSDKPKPNQKPKRSTSFGHFDAFRRSSPVKNYENGTNQHADNEPDAEGDQYKSGALGKKMKAISMTMRKRMGRKYAKALSEEMGDEVERKHGADSEWEGHSLRMSDRRASNSLGSLHSGQSSSSGITSGSDGSSIRDSLHLDEELPYTGHFCGRARVHTDFVPSPYDADSLRLKVGDIIDVISKPPMGIWTGVLHNKVGNFKFIYINLLEEEMGHQRERTHRRSELPMPKTLQELLQNLHLEEYAATLLLNGYQTLEDLRELKEQHLVELNMSNQEHRQLLLSAADCLDDAEDGKEAEDTPVGYTDPLGNQKQNCPRDSGCYITLESSENGLEDTDGHAPSPDGPLPQS